MADMTFIDFTNTDIPIVMVRDENARDNLPANYKKGTIAFTPGFAQAWQKQFDGTWTPWGEAVEQ